MTELSDIVTARQEVASAKVDLAIAESRMRATTRDYRNDHPEASLAVIAEAAGVSRETARYWLMDEDARAARRESRRNA